jgi:plastocyanin
MQDWKITIVEQEDGTIGLVPDQPSAELGSPLIAQQDDNVHWFNSTDETLQVVFRGKGAVTLSPIPSNSSSKAYDVAQPSDSPNTWTVTYDVKDTKGNVRATGQMIATVTPIAIEIVTTAQGTTTFSPNPMGALLNDAISWLNSTNQAHQIVATNGSDSFMSNPIPLGLSSSPLYIVTQPPNKPKKWTVNYSCLLHPNEQGTLSAAEE